MEVGERGAISGKISVEISNGVQKFQHYGNLMCGVRLELRQIVDAPPAAERFDQ